MNQITQDAAEFGVHLRSGGWRLGLLVARSVEKGTAGRPPKNHRDHDDFGKVSAQEFARESRTSADRVLRYLEAWGRAAEIGLVPPADHLSPGLEVDLPDEEETSWSGYYAAGRSSNTESVKRSKPAVARAIAEDPEFAAAAAHELAASQPHILAAVVEANAVAADVMDQALATRRPKPVAPRREHEPTAFDLIADLRSIHRTIDRIATAVTGGHVVVTSDIADGVVAEVDWLQNALGLIKSGVQSDSLDEQLARLVGDI